MTKKSYWNDRNKLVATRVLQGRTYTDIAKEFEFGEQRARSLSLSILRMAGQRVGIGIDTTRDAINNKDKLLESLQ